jgi:Hypothetical glycosyl hydrolase family 15
VDEHSDLWHARDVSDVSHRSTGSLRIGRREFARLTLALGTSVVAACSPVLGARTETPAVSLDKRPASPEPKDSSGGFPKCAVCFLAQENLPTPEQFARYDLIVIDSEWFGRLGPGFFADLRGRNPGARLLAYVNLVDYSTGLGDRADWANRYSLWQYETPSRSVFPREWLATTASGENVSEWPHTLMTNLTDAAKPVGGLNFAQYAANWAVDHVWQAGVWDGIYLDVWGDRVWSADHVAWDYRRDGTDVPDSEIYGLGNPWERGVNQAEVIMRARLPSSAIIVANGTRTMRNRQLNGRVWEHFLDSSSGSDREGDLNTYMTETSGRDMRQPGYPMTINTRDAPAGSVDEYRGARYFLTATLLQNGYWAPMVDSEYGQLNYYDEIDGAGLGRGYLGSPLVANPDLDRLNAPFEAGMGVVAPDVYRRDFDNGVVLHNAGTAVQTIKFDEPLRLLAGKQDPSVNTGQPADSITLGGRDGRILVRR